MTEKDLRIELECYKLYINPDCDIDNMSKDEVKDFYENYLESERYNKGLQPKGE